MVPDDYLGPGTPPMSWLKENIALTNYSFVFPFETYWKDVRVEWVVLLRDTWTVSFYGFVAYVLIVFLGEKAMSYKRKPFELRTACLIWNTVSAIFSVLGFVRTTPELFRVLRRHGFQHSVCESTYLQDVVFCYWIVTFAFAKYAEFLDTIFLILRKKPVSFLHWYHHGTVLLFTWHGARSLNAAGRWFCWMNYGVHTFVYAYFSVCTYGYRCPKWVPMLVTIVQMSQMVMGCAIGLVTVRVKLSGQNCHHPWSNLYMALAIYSVFVALFAQYFYKRYIRKTTTTTKPVTNGQQQQAKID